MDPSSELSEEQKTLNLKGMVESFPDFFCHVVRMSDIGLAASLLKRGLMGLCPMAPGS